MRFIRDIAAVVLAVLVVFAVIALGLSQPAGADDPYDVVSVPPVVEQFDCAIDDVAGVLTIPAVTGLDYVDIYDEVVDPGEYLANAGSYKLIVEPRLGYTVLGESSFTVEVTDVPPCEGELPDLPSLPADPLPAPPARAVSAQPDFTG